MFKSSTILFRTSLLFFLVFVIPFGSVKSQNLVDTNKIWNVVEELNYGESGTVVYRLGADTTIGTNVYKKILVNYDSASYIVGFPIGIREDTISKKVYFSESNIEALAYDFSLNQGDTFITNLSGCNIQMIVDSVDTILLLNGETRKRLFFPGWTNEIWIEGIGSLNGLPHVGLYLCSADVYATLNCFTEDDTLKYQNIYFPNCFFNTLGLTEPPTVHDLVVKPNPFSEFTTISFEAIHGGVFSLYLYNLSGQIVREYKGINEHRLEISKETLTSGIYFCHLWNERSLVGKGKLVVE